MAQVIIPALAAFAVSGAARVRHVSPPPIMPTSFPERFDGDTRLGTLADSAIVRAVASFASCPSPLGAAEAIGADMSIWQAEWIIRAPATPLRWQLRAGSPDRGGFRDVARRGFC